MTRDDDSSIPRDVWNRRRFLQTAGLGAAALITSGCASLFGAKRLLPSGRKPNILFIMGDDHASHAMSCYGSKINKTPNMDRIAREGALFQNCFCTNSICAPSRAVILTGRYSHINGVTDNGQKFDGSQETFPKLLRAAGYQTALIGKWHLQSDPTGFDHWCILPGQGAYNDPVLIEMGTRKKHPGYATDIITDLSIAWLKQRDPQKPFLLMCQHKAPHRNWVPDAAHAGLFKDTDVPEPPTFNDDYRTRSDAARLQEMTIERHLTQNDVKEPIPPGLEGQGLKNWKYQRFIKDYLRCIASVDDNIGRLLDYLDQSGLTKNTLVIYTSDQGFFLGDHGWFDKRFMYEESFRMPLVMRLPAMIKAGSVNQDLVMNLDFAPTFLECAGVPVSTGMQGRSMLPLLRGKTPRDWRRSVYYHYYEYPAEHAARRHYGVRTKRHKLIHFYYDIDAWELYDLQNDPHELNNLYADPACAGIVKELKAELNRLKQQYRDPVS
jgi:arylsulfatase A-like enzyme